MAELCQRGPVEFATGVLLATGRDMLVSDHAFNGVPPPQGTQKLSQRSVLGGIESRALQALKLDADGEIIAR